MEHHGKGGAAQQGQEEGSPGAIEKIKGSDGDSFSFEMTKRVSLTLSAASIGAPPMPALPPPLVTHQNPVLGMVHEASNRV